LRRSTRSPGGGSASNETIRVSSDLTRFPQLRSLETVTRACRLFTTGGSKRELLVADVPCDYGVRGSQNISQLLVRLACRRARLHARPDVRLATAARLHNPARRTHLRGDTARQRRACTCTMTHTHEEQGAAVQTANTLLANREEAVDREFIGARTIWTPAASVLACTNL
jgi:hypothetical protein